MNFLAYSKILLLFLFACSSPVNAEQISSKQLKDEFIKITGLIIPKAEKGQKGAEIIPLFLSSYTYKDKAFPRKRLEAELKENYTLFGELGMDLPTIMTSFIKRKELTNTQLLLAVRISRYVNSQIATE